MIDSFKYGLPLGLVTFLAWYAQITWFPEVASLWRWIIVTTLGCAAVGWSVRERNRAFFPFRYAFLTYFNVYILTTLVLGAMMFLLRREWLEEVPEGISETKWVLSHVYTEAMGFLVIALINSAIFGWLLRRKTK